MPKITGGKAHTDRLRRLAETVGPELSQALEVAADAVKAEARVLITTGSSSFGRHVPSRPGEPPNQDTGNLGNHIEVEMIDPLKAQVESNAPYAAALEYGTSKMAARPYMAPALTIARKDFPDIFTAAVKRGVRAAR